MSPRAMVEQRHHHGHKGNPFHVGITLKARNHERVASRDPALHQAHGDVHVGIRDAFDAICRQVEDHVSRQRGGIKTHDTPAHGRKMELYSGAEYG